MKILVVGSDQIFSIENYFVTHFREFGVEVDLLPTGVIFLEYYNKNLINKLAFRSGLSNVYEKINDLFLKKIEDFKPNVIWIFKGLEIFPKSLQLVKKSNIRLVNYNPDNPFIFSGRGSGNDNIAEAVPLYDLHFTYNIETQRQLQNEFNKPTSMLPFGFELDQDTYTEAQNQHEVLKTCFLGNPDKQRAAFIRHLADSNIKIDVYGNFWGRFLRHKNVEIHHAVFGTDLWMVLRKYRAQLNLMRPHNLDSHNMRTFEVPGVGGIMVAPNTTEHSMFFENAREAFFFNDVNGCARIINELMSLSTEEALKIRTAARERSLSSGYDYRSRAKSALNAIEKLLQ